MPFVTYLLSSPRFPFFLLPLCSYVPGFVFVDTLCYWSRYLLPNPFILALRTVRVYDSSLTVPHGRFPPCPVHTRRCRLYTLPHLPRIYHCVTSPLFPGSTLPLHPLICRLDDSTGYRNRFVALSFAGTLAWGLGLPKFSYTRIRWLLTACAGFL